MSAPATVYSDARAALASGEIDVLTSDIFDTLVWRDAALPHDLFRALGVRLIEAGRLPDHVTPADVLDARIHAERRARRRAAAEHGVGECTLEEIWARMPADWIAGVGSVAACANEEIAMEAEHLRPIAAAVDVLRFAHERGVRIALVSDTYFSTDQLRALLAAIPVELPPLASIAASSEYRDNKSNSLLARAIADLGADPGRALHIGDNPHADGGAADRAGARSIVLDVPHAERIGPAMPRALAAFSGTHGTDAGASALSRSLLLDAGAARTGVEPASLAPSASYEFGVTVGGPLLTGFADWIVDRTHDLGATHVHYLLREGAFIADVVDELRSDAPTRVHLHASRWVMSRAAVIDGTFDELVRALLRRAVFHPAHVTEAFDVDPDAVARLVGRTPLDDSHAIPAIEALADDGDIRAAIVASAAELRGRVLRYLARRIQPSENGRIVLCDIGWGGTIQEALGDILRAGGYDIEIVGLYLMLSRPGRERAAAGQRLAGYLPDDGVTPIGVTRRRTTDPDTVMRTPEIPEQLCTPELGTLLDIDPAGEPIVDPDVGGAVESRRDARAGVIDFAAARRNALPSASHDPRLRSDAYRAALLSGLAGTIRRPSQRLARELGTWQHDDVGGRHHEPLVPVDAHELLRYANAADVDLIGTRHVYWLHGAAALSNPALAAQLDAVEAGVDPDEICPRSDVGAALIAVFPPGDVLATAQERRVPHRSPSGWTSMRLSTAVDRLRDVRIDLGTDALIFELGRITIRSADRRVDVLIERTGDPRLRWHGGAPTGRRTGALSAGGHLIIGFGDVAVDGVLDIEAAVRTLPADGHRRWSPVLSARAVQLARGVRGRVAHVARRRRRATDEDTIPPATARR